MENVGWQEPLFRESFRYGVESAYAGDWIHKALYRNECDFPPNLYSARSLADYIVTEYGVASMQGKCVRERAEALISLAHPDFRPELKNVLLHRFYSTPG